jgi:hypothetical protein
MEIITKHITGPMWMQVLVLILTLALLFPSVRKVWRDWRRESWWRSINRDSGDWKTQRRRIASDGMLRTKPMYPGLRPKCRKRFPDGGIPVRRLVRTLPATSDAMASPGLTASLAVLADNVGSYRFAFIVSRSAFL